MYVTVEVNRTVLSVPNNPYSLCGRKATLNLNTKCFQTSGHVPVLTIMTSRPVWGIIITHTCSNFGTYTFLTNIPTYMKEVLHFDIKQVRVLTLLLPYGLTNFI